MFVYVLLTALAFCIVLASVLASDGRIQTARSLGRKGDINQMSLPAKSLEAVLAMNAYKRTDYFENFARYFEDAPIQNCYAIRVGSHTLTDSDTYSLRCKFDRLLKKGETK